MTIYELFKFVEELVSPFTLEELTRQELGRLLQKKFKLAFFMDEEGKISFFPSQEEAEK